MSGLVTLPEGKDPVLRVVPMPSYANQLDDSGLLCSRAHGDIAGGIVACEVECRNGAGEVLVSGDAEVSL